MKSEGWSRIKEIVDRALALSSQERASFLDEACAGDPTLRREVETLLRLDDEIGSFIEDPAFKLVDEDEPDDEAEANPRIGPYQVLRQIGRGGMGTVHLAERVDGEFEQRVAIKLIKRGMDSDEIVRRFRYERQILAALDHPNIARLLDGGTTRDGRPYFVMEHIEGQPIDTYCDQHQLSTSERLELFRTVCGALHFAHQNLVVHRDLKPGNILVTAEGIPKLLDFGIAKLLQADGEEEATRTVLGRRMLTPGYASPEQLRGERITTASDIYTLGVVLYQLLTGRRPFPTGDSTPETLLERVSTRVPTRPSLAVGRREEREQRDGTRRVLEPEAVAKLRRDDPQGLRRRLSGDLDSIALKAMRAEPGDRYVSAERLAEDIDRHLEGLPVMARKGTFFYLASKFLRRNGRRLAVGVPVLLLIGWLFSTNVLQQRRLERENERSEQLMDYVLKIFEGAAPEIALEDVGVFRKIIDTASSSLADELADQPELQATFSAGLARIYRKLGELDLAEEEARDSLDMRLEYFDSEYTEIASSHNGLGLVLRDMARYLEAEYHFREALKLLENTDDVDPRYLATALNNLAGVVKNFGRYEEAIELYRRALAIRYELAGDNHRDLGALYNNLGALLTRTGLFGEAELLLLLAKGLREPPKGEHPKAYANTLGNLGRLYRDSGRLEEGLAMLEESLALRNDLRSDSIAVGNIAVGKIKGDLALCYQKMGDLQKAETLYAEALELLNDLLDPQHIDLAAILKNQASFYVLLDDCDTATETARRAIDIYQEKVPPDPDGSFKHPDQKEAEAILQACRKAA